MLEMVPGTGLEPVLPFGNLILSQKRLPFRHPGDGAQILTILTLENASEKKVRNVRSAMEWPEKWAKSGQD